MVIFFNKYKKLLNKIKSAKINEEVLILPNHIALNFKPGHEYDECRCYLLPHVRDSKDEIFFNRMKDKIGHEIYIEVYDCFSGTVKLLALGDDRMFVEIIDANACYGCQRDPVAGTKFWVGDWEISQEENTAPLSGFEESDLPF